MSGGVLLAVAMAVVGQGIPAELKRNSGRPIDPALHPEIKIAAERASEAELDPKRGPGNAMEILKAWRAEQPNDDLKLSLDLRVAATVLRSRFYVDKRLPEDERVARALSTYSKLDLIEPGFRVWLDRAIAAAKPELKAKLMTKEVRRIKFHLAMQGSGIDPAPLLATLTKQVKELGFELVKSSPTEADIVGKLSTLEVRDEGGKALVRTSLDLTRITGPEPRWKKALFRTVEAPDAKVALLSASDWLLRMGGKEMLFGWLESQGMTNVIMSMPGHDHDHEGGTTHPQRAPIASPGAPPATVAPKVVLPGGGKEPTPAPQTKRAVP